MINLENLKANLSSIVSTMSKLTNMEYAIFNTHAELISSTPLYLKHKGENVHSASIEEVLSQGNVVVNKPGLMSSCIGCRFVNNCPSTIEILSSIKLDGELIGVISLTSFVQDGHNLITSNTANYVEILEYTSNLISMFALNERSRKESQFLHKIIEQLINDMNNNYLVIDRRGLLVHWDQGVKNMFSYCDLYTQNIDLIFPEDITNWIFNSRKAGKKYCATKDFQGIIDLTPLKIEDQIVGYTIKLESDKNNLPNELHPNYLDSIISKSPKIKDIKNTIKKITSSKSSVLITGDTGTGKELIAKSIHFTGSRSHNPFIPINCANIPESLFESELFGYEEGAFTGSKKGGKSGLFQMAEGGTIFLDEIGEMPSHLQPKLLRVLQDGHIQRLGSVTPIPVDLRVIAATNQDLQAMIDKNEFRDDLFYRLNVIPIHLPPLIKRLEDVELLAQHFIEKYSKSLNKNITSISQEALDAMTSYSWPGNIREVENAIEYAINMEEGSTIEIENIPSKISSSINRGDSFKEVIAEAESDLILDSLNRWGWDLSGKEKAAEELGISLRTLYRKLKEFQL